MKETKLFEWKKAEEEEEELVRDEGDAVASREEAQWFSDMQPGRYWVGCSLPELVLWVMHERHFRACSLGVAPRALE